MTKVIEISPGSEDGESEAESKRLRQIEKNQAAIALLESWGEATDEEIQEQQETWEFLKRALDEDRLSDRKFFQP